MKIRIFHISTVLLFLGFTVLLKAEPIPINVNKCVAFILKSEATEKQPIGTGFFVGYKYPERNDVSYIFFVTAKHVLFDDEGNRHSHLLLRMNDKATGSAKDFNVIKPNAWFFHRNAEAVDIAVQPLKPKDADFLYVSSKLFITNDLIEKNKIGIGDDVFYSGLLSYHIGKKKISPIVRFGKLALITDEKTIDGQFYNYIDSGNIPGHSGAPVFLWATPSRSASQIVAGSRIFGLYGIVVGVVEYNKKLEATIPRKTYHQRIPIDARSGGITAMVPIKFLSEILESSQIKTAIGLSNTN
jgi:hypothetical protein